MTVRQAGSVVMESDMCQVERMLGTAIAWHDNICCLRREVDIMLLI